MQDSLLQEFLSRSDGRARGAWLALRDELQRREVLEAWEKSDDFDLNEALELPPQWRYEALSFLIGCRKRHIKESRRTFIVAPVGKPVMIENGTYLGIREHITIAGPEQLSARAAINALLQYGPYAESLEQRGKLKLLTLQEFAEQAAAKKGSKASKAKGK